MKARVYKNRCNGCTICNITCPEVFAIGEDGKALVKNELVPRGLQGSCRDAADECPSNAIVLEGVTAEYVSRAVLVAGVK